MQYAIQIRDAALADTPFIVDANARLAEETEGKTLHLPTLQEGVAAALNDSSKARYWIAEWDGERAGQLMVTLEWSDWRNGHFWWIQSVYVHAPFRRRGVFRALYQHVESTRHQNKADVCGLRLYVELHNEAAQKTYKQLGMEQTAYQLFECEASSFSPKK